MASDEGIIKFTIGVKEIISFFMADPKSRAEMVEAIKSRRKCDPTKPCGYANLGTTEEPDWWSFFMATDRNGIGPGEEGFIWRTIDGKRTCARLRRQDSKAQAAEVVAEETNISEGSDLLQAALDGDKEAAQKILSAIEPDSAV